MSYNFTFRHKIHYENRTIIEKIKIRINLKISWWYWFK